jgi:hypothetical protein
MQLDSYYGQSFKRFQMVQVYTADSRFSVRSKFVRRKNQTKILILSAPRAESQIYTVDV